MNSDAPTWGDEHGHIFRELDELHFVEHDRDGLTITYEHEDTGTRIYVECDRIHGPIITLCGGDPWQHLTVADLRQIVRGRSKEVSA